LPLCSGALLGGGLFRVSATFSLSLFRDPIHCNHRASQQRLGAGGGEMPEQVTAIHGSQSRRTRRGRSCGAASLWAQKGVIVGPASRQSLAGLRETSAPSPRQSRFTYSLRQPILTCSALPADAARSCSCGRDAVVRVSAVIRTGRSPRSGKALRPEAGSRVTPGPRRQSMSPGSSDDGGATSVLVPPSRRPGGKKMRVIGGRGRPLAGLEVPFADFSGAMEFS
jgi:hypothetical protein